MPHLRVREGDGPTANLFPLGKKKEIVIGRASDCDLVLPRNYVSRHHARLYERGDKWVIADLRSSRGTFLNGNVVEEATLAEGDEIRIGEWVIVYSAGAAKTGAGPVVLPKAPTTGEVTSPEPVPEILESREVDAGELLKTAMFAATLDLKELAGSPQPAAQLAVATSSSAAPGESPLMTLIAISEGIHRATSVDEVCRVALEMALRAASADRGVIALRDREEKGYQPRAQVTATGKADKIRMSKTFVDRALLERKALIARDVGQDFALASAKSVMALDIRSMLCVPLLDGGQSGGDVLGFLYLDRVGTVKGFGPRDLELVCLVVHHAAAEVRRLGEQERRQAMARFFSGDVIKHLEQEAKKGGDGLSSSKAQVVTVLFADIQGFTALSEGLDPAELKRFLDVYFDRMTEILVDRHGGTLDKYIGDAIMALFGAPFSRGEAVDAKEAVAAAVEMMESVAKLRAESPAYSKIAIRIGINTGRVVAGMMGSKRRLEYSVLGDAVNVASRLESTSEPGKIQIGPETRTLVGDEFQCESAGERKVKNRAAAVASWWVLGPK